MGISQDQNPRIYPENPYYNPHYRNLPKWGNTNLPTSRLSAWSALTTPKALKNGGPEP